MAVMSKGAVERHGLQDDEGLSTVDSTCNVIPYVKSLWDVVVIVVVLV